MRTLEELAKTCPLLSVDAYEEGPADLSTKGQATGVQREKRAVGSNEGQKKLDVYRPLDVSRLKLTGRGGWDLSRHLNDELWLPYVEPAILRHGIPRPDIIGPNLLNEDKAENLKLAKLWSTQGLLCLSPTRPPGDMFSRVFNNLKNDLYDRQIGDRRLMNGGERSISGPSRSLPGGYLITSMHCPAGFQLVGAVTDRKDFYHQSMVSRQRAMTNCLPFGFSPSLFEGEPALEDLAEYLKSLSGPREKVGDQYLGRPRGANSRMPDLVYPCFSSLFQGDHLGVEYALSSHADLLEEASLLSKDTRIRGHCPFPTGPVYEGLVIDDYFSVALQHVSDPSSPRSLDCFEKAIAKYAEEGVLGSPEKDIYNSNHFKVVGAEVNCSEKARSRGVVTVASPSTKRLSLVALSLRTASLPIISRGLASRLAGCWTSTLLFRRCLSSCLSEIYKLGVLDGRPEDEILVLTRKAAEEIVLASVLAFVACSNIRVPYHKRVFATDASMKKGAVVSRDISLDLAKCLWLGGDKKGAYTRLDNPFRSVLRQVGCEEEDFSEKEENDEYSFQTSHAPSRFAFEFSFDFAEICGGSGVVSRAAARLGLNVLPPIELSDSPHFDLGNGRLLEWICFMLQTGKIRSIMCEPPCTSFSPAAHPAVRSYKEPLGFNRKCRKTSLGNLLAFRCCFLLWVAWHYDRPSLLEQPFLSKMAWLAIWRFLLSKGFAEAAVASCAFGSPHLKKFRLLCHGLDTDFLTVPCSGDHKHVRIEGKLTKPSAVYVPKLAEHFAIAFATAVRAKAIEKNEDSEVVGIESVVANDVLMTGEWKVDLQWFWKTPSHINILESHAFLALLKMLLCEGGDCRFPVLIDSRVAKCAHAKGRSSSRALLPSLRKSCALQICGGLYAAFGFAPTRLNTADDPTRDEDLRPSSRLSCLSGISLSIVQYLHSLQFSRPSAGWVRLVILLGFCPRVPAYGISNSTFTDACQCNFLHLYLFIGFFLVCGFSLFVVWISLSRLTDPNHPKSFRGKQLRQCSHCPPIRLVLLCCVAMASGQPSAADRVRAARRAGNQLFTDRVMRPETRKRRDVLLEKFDIWCRQEHGVGILNLLEADVLNPGKIGQLLVWYGRCLYVSGKPYGSYSETINAVVAKRGSLRRQLGVAWDLAFSWVADEPGSHHPAMPRSVVLSLATLAMLWGWPTEAAIFLLCWTGLMRRRRGKMLSCQEMLHLA